MTRVVNQQNAAVLYFTLLPNQILTWLLKPGEGLVRFYAGKAYDPTEDYTEKIQTLIKEIKAKRDTRHMAYECENRALSQKGYHLSRVRNENKKLSQAYKREQIKKELEKEIAEKENKAKSDSIMTSSIVTSSSKRQKSAERQLFDLLLAPIDDLLSQLDEGSPLVIIPDKLLCECPFSILKDWNGKQLQSRLRVAVCPSLLALDKV